MGEIAVDRIFNNKSKLLSEKSPFVMMTVLLSMPKEVSISRATIRIRLLNDILEFSQRERETLGLCEAERIRPPDLDHVSQVWTEC